MKYWSVGASCALLAVACGSSSATEPETSNSESALASNGALVKMQMRSTVGVLLDEIPAGVLRDRAAARALNSSSAFWTARAHRQIRLASYRLVFRSAYYTDPRGPLPLPPKSVWNVHMVGAPVRATIDGHDLVTQGYSFDTYLISDAASTATTEPNLASVGGTWQEPFLFPADPELLIERTGFACMNEFEFPRNSVFEENRHYFYDQTCPVETAATAACHVTELPVESCVDSLRNHVGTVSANIEFKRVKYDASIAGRYRVGTITNHSGADLAVFQEDMVDERAVYYRYFGGDSCELQEGVIGAPGWRRLITFSASVQNNGTEPIHLGNPRDATNPWVTSNVFEFSQCHQHYHFSHYGTFGYNGAAGSKRAFCLEDTNRYHNDETTPLTAIHQSCEFQGVGAGWGDEYNFGLPGQWVDVTDVDTSQPHDLTFRSNPDQFLCEGSVLDANNHPVDPLDLASIAFDPTSFRTADGAVVSRIRCSFPSNWAKGNVGKVSMTAPPGGFVTYPCTRGEIGPNRSCGLSPAPTAVRSCTAGSTVRLRCSVRDQKQAVRICERSAKLGGIPCTLRESLANAVVSTSGTTVSFPCPAVRDGTGGGYSTFQGPILPGDDSETEDVHCVPF